MTVWSVDKNADAMTMVITAEFKASVTNVWQLWADPRLLERWWGPPGFPATFEHHDLTPGGTITYYMTGADGGDRFDGTWNVVEVDAPTRLVVEDAIVDDDGTPSDGNSMTRMEIDIEATGDITRMILTTHFDSLEGMEQAVALGVVEGMKAWMSQIDTLLDEVAIESMSSVARRMFELVEPIGVIPYSAEEPNEAMFALGFTNFWDTYFAGRAAPLGLVPAEVVDALFYNFAPGEVARHIPKVWRTTTPELAIAARQMGCVKALRQILGDGVDSPAFARATELLIKAAISAPCEGRPMYAALRAMPIPDEVVACLFHAASLLREHRGDGHVAALMVEGVGGLEAHVLFALAMDMPAEKFGRIHHLPAAQLTAVIDGMRDRGLIGDDGWLSEHGRAVKQRVESVTDDLAAKPYESLGAGELDELMEALEPLAALLLAAQDWN